MKLLITGTAGFIGNALALRLLARGDEVVGVDTYDAIILAVAHPEFLQWGAAGIHALGKAGHVLYDVKSLLPKGAADGRL